MTMGALVTEVKWAVVFVATLLSWMVLERVVGLHDEHIDQHMVYTNLFAIPAIAVYVFALRDKKRRDLAGSMTYLQALNSGAVLSVMIAIMSPGIQWVVSTIITPDYFTNAINYSVTTGFHESREAAEAYFNLQNYMMQSAVGALGMGLVTTVIVGAFLRSRSQQAGV